MRDTSNAILQYIALLVAAAVCAVMMVVRQRELFLPKSKPFSNAGNAGPLLPKGTAASGRLPERPIQQWGAGSEAARAMHAIHIREIRDMDRANKRYDVVVYGDSITAGIRNILQVPSGRNAIFTPYFGKNVVFAAFGCPANIVEDVGWRLNSGGEKPRLDPRVVVFWIGTNNLGMGTSPVDKLDALVAWARTAMPKSHIVILSLLPRTIIDVKPVNARYADIARKRGAHYVACGQNLNPSGPDYIDGLHIKPPAYAAVMKCLAAQVKSLLTSSVAIPR